MSTSSWPRGSTRSRRTPPFREQFRPSTRALFGRPPCNHIESIDVTVQALDSASLGHGLERTVAEQHRVAQEVLEKRQVIMYAQRTRCNARILPESPGTKAAVGELALVRETTTSLHRRPLPPEAVTRTQHEPVDYPQRRLGALVLHGAAKVSAADIKPFHKRPLFSPAQLTAV